MPWAPVASCRVSAGELLVTCICVCHNKPDFAHEAIQSIVNQRYPKWEALIVDSGVLFDAGYYDRFPWRWDARLKLIRSHETEETRRTKAMAPWCFNECIRQGLVTGDLVMYLCDDDLFYPNAFETFAYHFRRNPDIQAMYASQDIGLVYPNGWRTIVGERRATLPGGKDCNGRAMDCQVDYLQFCHRTDVLRLLPGEEYWPESKDTESHADGVFMERIGERVTIHPIDIKVSQNRRTLQSTYDPASAFTIIQCMANGVPLRPDSAKETPKMRDQQELTETTLVTIGITPPHRGESRSPPPESLSEQSYPNLYVMVPVDHDVRSGSAPILKEMTTRYPHVQFLFQDDADGDSSWDRCLREAQGEYFISMEAGTRASPDMVERFVARLGERPDLSALTCYVAALTENADLFASMKNVYSGGIFRTAHLRAVAGNANCFSRGQVWSRFFSLVNAGFQVDIVPEHLFYNWLPSGGIHPTQDNSFSDKQLLREFFDKDRRGAAERAALWGALAELQERFDRTAVENEQRMEQLKQKNLCLQTQLNSLRYRVADRINALWSRAPVSKKRVKQLLALFT